MPYEDKNAHLDPDHIDVPGRRYRDNDDDDDDDDDNDELEPIPARNERNRTATGAPENSGEAPRRQFKYSTAAMPKRSKWRRYCCIFLLFLAGFLIMMGLSMLMNKLFFDTGPSDKQPVQMTRDPNDTFPENKDAIDQACSGGSFDADGGKKCRSMCEPQFVPCCDAFSEYKTFNYSDAFDNTTNTTVPPIPMFNATDGFNQTCSLDQNARGCVGYSKCQAIAGIVDPAPSTLPILCSKERLQQDPVSCKEACRDTKCCYEDDNNCLSQKFTICLDYAPCQNLRIFQDSLKTKIWTAPPSLDQVCLWGMKDCFDICESVKCCGDRTQTSNSCFKDNFISCLTYAACSNATFTDISMTRMYSYLPQPSIDVKAACNADRQKITTPPKQTCNEMCSPVECCYEQDPGKNCYNLDPLGCEAWNHECQLAYGPLRRLL